MKNKVLKLILMPNTRIYLWTLAVFVVIITFYNLTLGIISTAILLYMIFYNWKIEHDRKKMWTEYIEKITEEIDDTSKHALINLPIPLTVIEIEGTIVWYNSKFVQIADQKDLFNKNIEEIVPGLKAKDFINSEDQDGYVQVILNEKIYKVTYNVIRNSEDNNYSIVLYWYETTNYENLKTLYNDEKTIVGYIHVDNYEDVIQSSSAEKQPILTAEIDKTIRLWASRLNACITKYDDDKYSIILENRHLEKLEVKKFTILDEIREIETDSDFPATLSIGLGVGGKSPAQQAEFATAALDLAYGRGGDQAVIKKINKIEYYGGKSQVVEKRNKGKSRIMAHALRQLINQSSNVVVMGHKFPDMDCFGAALGIYRMAVNRNKEVSIILEEVNDGIRNLYDIVNSTGNYEFITNDMAMSLVGKDTLVVVVDTYRPSFTQCPEILKLTDKIVVIDHHRKMEEYIDNAVLSYMEPYASSASELVTEILQYLGDKKEIEKIEAEALLAGIVVDTKNFSFKTGVRTFEAASWLRRIGADTTNVKQLFQSDMDIFIAKAEIIRNAQKVTKTIALSVCDTQNQSTNIIIAQAADELLEIKGIKASFVIGLNNRGDVIVSARSLGDINVQVIMEKIGGGGHLTMAGAQSDKDIHEVTEQLLEAIKEYVKEGETE